MRLRQVTCEGGCHTCGASWTSRNAMGLAAQHMRRYGHDVWVEASYAGGPVGRAPARESEHLAEKVQG